MSALYLPSEMKEGRAPSYVSLNKDFILLKPNKPGQLLRGPRRVVRLCVFALLLPAVLITVPLYVRLVLYPPAHYPMMPTDQRLLSRHASSFWCQAQSTHMNGSFTSYLTRGRPELRPDRRTYVMLNHLKARDDVKEYWGFYLLRGSTVTISSCARWSGGQLMILRGVENLHRCAWIGEKDSAENLAEDDDDISNERHRQEDLARARRPSVYQAPDDYSDPEAGIGAEATGPEAQPLHSEERRQGITKLLRKALKMSKDKSEILKILHSEGKNRNSLKVKQDGDLTFKNNTNSSAKVMLADQATSQDGEASTSGGGPTPTEDSDLMTPSTPRRLKKNRRLKDDLRQRRLNKRRRKKGNTRDKNLTEEELPAKTRLRRDAEEEEEDTDGAFEELDTEDVLDMLTDGEPRKTPAEERALGAQVFFPEGLKYERGTVNQTTANDNSREEQVSSFSSSEEALASCEGVIINLQLVPYRRCNYQSLELNKISYDIPITGTYYFVFSSDNEIYVNDIYFNVTMERVVYNVSKREEMCTNTTDCLMPLSFWSNDQTVVEVPPEATWDHSYVMDVKCEPRVYIYLSFLLLVPLLIMCCAFY
ncbi:uncharacterized protein LOC135112697 [Scylla paramamosain]